MPSISKNQGALPLTLDVVSLCSSTFCTTTSPPCSAKVVCAQRLQCSCPFPWNCSGFFLSCSVRALYMITIDAYTSECNNQFSKPSSSHIALFRVWQCWNLVFFFNLLEKISHSSSDQCTRLSFLCNFLFSSSTSTTMERPEFNPQTLRLISLLQQFVIWSIMYDAHNSYQEFSLVPHIGILLIYISTLLSSQYHKFIVS